VDTELYSPAADHPAEDSHPFRIGYAGRLVEEKGVDLLLRAVAGVDGEWRVSILGDGPFKAHLMELSGALGVEDRVSFELPLPSSAMPSHYRKLDVLVLPSRARPHWKEQFGRVLIEAMACAVPVVGSDSGEIPHVIGDAGLLFPEDDVLALRAHLQALMGDRRLHRSLAQKGRERVVQHYTQRRIAEATRQVYVEVLAGQRP
jgi:glycosyltransferase involved in cell wall biosynthesis